jgi:hypothetical protein
MSINGMTNVALSRRRDFEPAGRTSSAGVATNAHFSLSAPHALDIQGQPPDGMTEGMASGTAVVTGTSADSIQTSLNIIFGYIPTEIVTLYTAASTALTTNMSADPASVYSSWWLFSVTAVITPFIVLIVFAGKAGSSEKPMPSLLNPKTWPNWEMFAATMAFVAWAYALPNSPFAQSGPYNPAIATIVLLFTTTLLGLLAPLFQKRIAVSSPP